VFLLLVCCKVGLAHELGTGTLDFFCEPARGLMISPEAFGTGLAKGSSSLLKGTIGGLMGAASAVTNSASKAMATASGDEAFMANQAAATNQKQPEHLGEGLKMGITAFGTSLFSGVTGVFLDPLAGARKEGLLGFGKVSWEGEQYGRATSWHDWLSLIVRGLVYVCSVC
jgi:vacuolar protein sorting-associated protein 13A/C